MVVIRWLLGAVVIHIRVGATTQILLGFMILSVAVTFAVPHCALLHSASAVLLGTGYGLVYPIVQAQAVSSADARHRHAVLTWFVASYFVGVFGFPALGSMVLVSMGKTMLLILIAACGLAALLLDRRAPQAGIGGGVLNARAGVPESACRCDAREGRHRARTRRVRYSAMAGPLDTPAYFFLSSGL